MQKQDIDFSRSLRSPRIYQQSLFILLFAFLLSSSTGLLILVYHVSEHRATQAELDLTQHEVESLRDEIGDIETRRAEEVDAIKASIESLRLQVQSRKSALSILTDNVRIVNEEDITWLLNRLPRAHLTGIWLNRIELTGTTRLRIDGVADSASLLSSYMTQLELNGICSSPVSSNLEINKKDNGTVEFKLFIRDLSQC